MLSFSNSFEFASLSIRGPNFLLNVLRLKVNPFAPEPPVNARADPGPFYTL